MFILFYLDPAQNDTVMISRCEHFIFCQGRELKLTDEGVLPVTEKERERGKGASALDRKMDEQTYVVFALTQMVGFA